jgi:hypothetical protein
VAAAFAALEDEAARAVAEVEPQQAGRRDVQVGRDAVLLEHARLVGASSGDERERRPHCANGVELLGAELRRHEPEHAHAPRAGADALRGALEHRARLRPAQQRERHERQRPAFGDRCGELGAVAHARHRTLHERKFGAVRGRERRAGRERPGGARIGEVRGDRLAQPGEDAADRDEAACERGRDDSVLAEREHRARRAVPADALGDGFAPRAACVAAAGVRHELGRPLTERVDAGVTGPREDPERQPEVGAERERLAAVERSEARAQLVGQRRLASEQHLGVEHGSRRSGGDERGHRVHPDAAVHQHGHRERRHRALRGHERAILARPARCFLATDDDGIGAGALGRPRLGRRPSHGVGAQAARVHVGDRVAEGVARVLEDHDVRAGVR